MIDLAEKDEAIVGTRLRHAHQVGRLRGEAIGEERGKAMGEAIGEARGVAIGEERARARMVQAALDTGLAVGQVARLLGVPLDVVAGQAQRSGAA